MTKHANMSLEQIIEMAESRKDESIYIKTAGIERKVIAKHWAKNGKERTYITIKGFAASGKCKGDFECGYYDHVTGEYVSDYAYYDIIDDEKNTSYRPRR